MLDQPHCHLPKLESMVPNHPGFEKEMLRPKPDDENVMFESSIVTRIVLQLFAARVINA